METVVLGVLAGSMYALIAAGITLVYKGSRVLNFAQAEIGTFALYLFAWVSGEHHEPWWLGALGALLLAVCIGLAFDRLFMRRLIGSSRVTAVVATIGLWLFLIALEAAWFGPAARANLPPPIHGNGPTIAGLVVSQSQLLSLVVVAVIAVALAGFLRFTDFGLAVLASADDPQAARLMGISQARVSAFTWGTAGALSAVAVLFIEPTIGALAPGAFSVLLLNGLTAALLGGLTSLPGAFVGGLLVGVAEAEVKAHVITTSLPDPASVGMLAIVLLVLLVRRQGIFGRTA